MFVVELVGEVLRELLCLGFVVLLSFRVRWIWVRMPECCSDSSRLLNPALMLKGYYVFSSMLSITSRGLLFGKTIKFGH